MAYHYYKTATSRPASRPASMLMLGIAPSSALGEARSIASSPAPDLAPGLALEKAHSLLRLGRSPLILEHSKHL